MGKGGGGGSTTSTAFQSSMPPWARGAHQRLIEEAENFAYPEEYPRYVDEAGNPIERIADFTPEEQSAFAARRQIFGQGDPYGDLAANQLTAAAQVPGQFRDVDATYQARQHDFGQFPGANLQGYMSPYQQAVTDAELRAATEEFQRQQNRSVAERVSEGSRGGYRGAIDDAFSRGEHQRTLGDIQARGSQSAFEAAQTQYNEDRNAAIRAAEMGDESAFRAATMRMEADQYNQKRLFDEMEARSTLARRTSMVGNEAQKRAYEVIREMERGGATQRDMNQALRDLAYEDFIRQQRHPQTQMNWLQGILAGVPSTMGTYSTQPGPNTIAQLLGLGIGGSGLAGLLGGGQSAGGAQTPQQPR